MIRTGFILLLLLLTTSDVGATTTSYSIGNSLTWDARPPLVRDVAALAGESMEVGYHIRCQSTLLQIFTDSNTTCVTPTSHGKWDSALPIHAWNVVTLQPYPGGGSTLATDQNVTLSMMNLALSQGDNNSTQFYVYQSFAAQSWWQALGYHDYWRQSVVNTPSKTTVPLREYYDHLVNNVRAVQPSVLPPILTIPAGDVIDAVNTEMLAGNLPGFNDAGDLYRDDFHFNNVGRFLLTHTWFATLYGESPAGLNSASLFPTSPSWPTDQTITPALADQLQRITWNVVRSHPQSGVGVVGDVDGDGNVTEADVPLLVQSLVDPVSVENAYPGLDLAMVGDLDGSGTHDLGDLAAMAAILAGSTSRAVPEPGTISLVVWGCGAWMIAGRRRRHTVSHVS